MAKETPTSGQDNAAQALRAVLIKRLAMAGGLVAVLLSVLAFFDYLSKASDEAEYPVFTEPVPVGPRKAITQPVTPAENLPEPPASDAGVASTETPASGDEKPAETTPAVLEPPPPPMPAATPTAAPAAARVPENVAPAASTAQAARRPESQRLAPSRPETAPRSPAVPSATVPAPRPAPSRAVAEDVTAPPPIQPTQPAGEARRGQDRSTPAERQPPLAESVPAAPAARIVQRTPRLFSGFVLQAGVFSSVQRAEELHARLTLSGVPSHVETRVQVGPFKTREEAEAAQIKLRELGIESVLVPAR